MYPKKYVCALSKSGRSNASVFVRIRTYSYVFAYVSRTYCVRIRPYPYVSYVFVRKGKTYRKRTKNTYEYVRYVRIRTQIRTQYVHEYVRNTYDTYTYVFVFAISYSYVIVRILVRIRTYRTYPFVLFHARTLLVSVLRHLLCRGLAGLCIHDAEAIRSRVPVRQVSLAFDVLELAFSGLTRDVSAPPHLLNVARPVNDRMHLFCAPYRASYIGSRCDLDPVGKHSLQGVNKIIPHGGQPCIAVIV